MWLCISVFEDTFTVSIPYHTQAKPQTRQIEQGLELSLCFDLEWTCSGAACPLKLGLCRCLPRLPFPFTLALHPFPSGFACALTPVCAACRVGPTLRTCRAYPNPGHGVDQCPAMPHFHPPGSNKRQRWQQSPWTKQQWAPNYWISLAGSGTLKMRSCPMHPRKDIGRGGGGLSPSGGPVLAVPVPWAKEAGSRSQGGQGSGQGARKVAGVGILPHQIPSLPVPG